MIKKIILHNKYSKESKEFLERYKNSFDDFIDWYDEKDRQRWFDMGGNIYIQGFPSIVKMSDRNIDELIFDPEDEEVEDFLNEDS